MAACGGQTAAPAAPADTPVPAAPADTPVPAAPTAVPATAVPPWTGLSVDLEAIFPDPPEMRELIIVTCTNCHNFVPIVYLQMPAGQWWVNRGTHGEYVPSLSDEQRDKLYAYLIENFNENTPIPDLPQVLLDQWTSY